MRLSEVHTSSSLVKWWRGGIRKGDDKKGEYIFWKIKYGKGVCNRMGEEGRFCKGSCSSHRTFLNNTCGLVQSILQYSYQLKPLSIRLFLIRQLYVKFVSDISWLFGRSYLRPFPWISRSVRRKICPDVLWKKEVFIFFFKMHRKTPVSESLFSQVAGVQLH